MIKAEPHQINFAKLARPYEGLWHGTGCTKTRTALLTVKKHDSILVVAPKTTVQKKQWQYEAGEIEMQIPDVIGKEIFRRDHKKLKRYKVLIVDEAHYVLGVSANTRRVNRQTVPKTSQLFDAIEWYIQTHKPDRVILVTATPNKTPMSVWAAAKLLGHDLDFYAFRDKFYSILPMNLPFGQVVYAPRRTKAAQEELAVITRSIGHVLRLRDIRKVPDPVYLTKQFELTGEQKKALASLPSRFTGDSSLRLKRHQVENGILYDKKFDAKTGKIIESAERFACAKIDYILERANEFEKMIVFANYTEQVNAIADALRKEGKNVFIMDSSTKDRKAIEKAAESADSAYIVAQASVSSEWEFKSCDVVIFASLSNKSIDYIQGQGRPIRYDAVKKMLYIHLETAYKNSIDSKWLKTIMNGRDFNEALYD